MPFNPPRTSYEDLLQQAQDEQQPFRMPSYMRVSNAHAVANKDKTWDESLVDTVDSVSSFIATSLISGANQLYNAPIDVANLFGADWERSDTGEVISNIDSDLGRYYQEHQDGVDTLGFIISSIVPGLGGVKALHAGQAVLRTALVEGKVGGGMSKALGLLVPSKQKYLSKAINDVIHGTSANVITNKNTLQAMAAGFGQSTLEAAAFETAVAATLFKSPVLENQDMGDLLINIAFGGLVGGAIGGAIDAAKIGYGVRKSLTAAEVEAKPWTAISEAHSNSDVYEKIALDFEQIENIPPIPTQVTSTGLTPELLASKAVAKAEKLHQRIRANIAEITKGDQDAAEALYQTLKDTSLDNKLGTFIGLKSGSRLADVTPWEKELLRIESRVKKGTASLEEVERSLDLNVGYSKIWGADAGTVSATAPRSTALIDTLKKGESITVKGDKLYAGKTTYSFSLKETWNTFGESSHSNQARHIWAQKTDKVFVGKANKPVTVGEFDIPLLEKAYRDSPEFFRVQLENGSFRTFADSQELFDFIHQAKLKVANRLQNEVTVRAKQLTQEDIANITNVRSSYLSGEQSKDITKDLFALQSYGEDFAKQIGAKRPVEIWNVPQTIKLGYDATPFSGLDGNVVEQMAQIKVMQRQYIDGAERATAVVFGEDYNKLVEITAKDIQGASSTGAGGSLITAASSNYGTLAAKVEYLGNAVTGLAEKAKKAAKEVLDPIGFQLAQKQEAAIEWSNLNATLRAIPDTYAINEAGTALEPLAIQEWREAARVAQKAGNKIPKAPVLQAADAPLEIPIQHAETLNMARAHIELNGSRVQKHTILNAAKGVQDTRKAKGFYPIPVDPKDYPYFALVSDESITGTGHVKTLYATSESELNSMIAKLKDNPQLTIRTKGEAEAYYKSIGQWDFEKSLNENYLNVTMHRKGVSAPYIIATDPKKIISDTINWHLQRETGLVREAVLTKYEVPFNELRRLGDQFTNLATSKFSSASLLKYAEDVVKNPYADYIKTALGIPKHSEYPWWVNTNRMADEAVSNMYNRITSLFEQSKSIEDLDAINAALKNSGYKGAAYDMDMELLANHTAPRGALSSFVQKANAILATVVLRWDALNAVNNAVSANVLLGAETKAVIRAIEAGNAEAVGELAQLAKITVPGTEHTMLAPSKLIANAIRKFGKDAPEMAFYKEHRFVTNISEQYRWTLDNLTLGGKETIKELNGKLTAVHSRLTDLANKGEKWTGNRLAEEFNRFVAADVMKQITDVGVKHGVITAKEQLAYINTFVNRTQGNYLAAQRPMLFQGPIGQSIGLFQTYQFNLMQQLLRHVGEGSVKDAMVLLGLQGTIHGMNGLPAFNAINTHIIGNASGNTEHTDLYDSVYGAVGKNAGDWLMYGVASNMFGLLHPDLKVNLYTRGDINPRHLTIVPTDPSQVPIVQASAKFAANILDTVGKLAVGGDVTTTILQGLEHNGISRPLAGLAQTLEGLANPNGISYSTSNRGNIIAGNDFFSLANLGRIAGGKPFDEALTLDASYRFKAYQLKDNKKRQRLGEAIKSTLIAGQMPTTEQIENFAQQYAEAGGKQENFNKWFGELYRGANVSQTNKMQDDLNGVFSQKMQRLMGGLELRDFE